MGFLPNVTPAQVVGGIAGKVSEGVGQVKEDLGVVNNAVVNNPGMNFAKAITGQTADLASHNPFELASMAANATPRQMIGALPSTQGINAALNPMQFGGGQ